MTENINHRRVPRYDRVLSTNSKTLSRDLPGEVIGRITHIACAPLKSAALVEVNSAILTPAGIEGDRGFMVVQAKPDENEVHHFVTQRDKRGKDDRVQGFADMVHIIPHMTGDTTFLTWDGKEPIMISVDEEGLNEIRVKIHKEIHWAVDLGKDIDGWLSDHLHHDLKGVAAAGSFKRQAPTNYLANNNPILFQDAYPVHWFFQESVDKLSERAGENIPWQSFRPNIVVSGSPAGTEYVVYTGRIGSVPFVDPKPCDRCPVTNVDQNTGEVKIGRALTHLNVHNDWINVRGERKVILGENMLPEETGKIRVGDEVVLYQRRNPPLQYGVRV
ncbi:MOSC domain-containing protein [Candidatus Gottesmanbacteria bacterium]|nr:MOSC domain-containing protein [Candidatus Gottesmanbacteria bacterium]